MLMLGMSFRQTLTEQGTLGSISGNQIPYQPDRPAKLLRIVSATCRQRASEPIMKYFEDIEVGDKRSFGIHEVTREEVIEFAAKYDPQAFHLDDAAAANTYFGRLSASGWHTCAMTMRMLVDDMAGHEVASLGSPGVDEIRWLRPVYPGDTLRCEIEFIEKRQSSSKPEMGSYRTKITIFNQDNHPVMTMISIGLIRVRGES